MTADYHLHSCFSGDSETPTEEMIKKGLAQGLSLMCMTDHLDMDYPYSDVSFDLDADAYFREMHRLQEAYHDRIEIRIGAELGIQPQLGDAYRQWLSDKSFDFLIGSTHLVDRFDPYYPDFWTSYDAASGVNRYLDVTLQNIRAFDDFDVYGHIDYIIRYVPDGDRVFSYKKHADHRTGKHVCNQHLYPIINHLIITDEHADNRLSSHKIQQCGRNSGYQAADLRKAFYFPEAADISSSIAVTQQWLYSVCQSHLQESNEHIGFKNNTDGCHRCISIFYQNLVDYNGGNAHENRKDSSWEAGSADSLRDIFS